MGTCRLCRFIVCCCLHSQTAELARPHLCNLQDMALDVSANALSVWWLAATVVIHIGLSTVLMYSSSTRVINYSSSIVLHEYSKRFVSGYHFHFRSSSPVIFGFREVANWTFLLKSFSLAGCRLAGCSHCSATATCQPACELYRHRLPA